MLPPAFRENRHFGGSYMLAKPIGVLLWLLDYIAREMSEQ